MQRRLVFASDPLSGNDQAGLYDRFGRTAAVRDSPLSSDHSMSLNSTEHTFSGGF
jgi:hypothetical protein